MTPPQSNSFVIYEQPLNERMRAFLRLEHLFNRAQHQLQDDDVWATRGVLEAIIDIMSLMSRADLKTELIKELGRHATTLEGLSANPRVDQERLRGVLTRIYSLLETLRSMEGTPGNELRQNEFLNSIRQRNSIPAGTCDFDLPGFHFWLQSPIAQQRADLRRWLSAFDLVRDSVSLCLHLVRESASANHEIARAGFFQMTLEKETPCQMVRVAVPAAAQWYPEISAGKHRFTIRFMLQDNAEARPVQTGEGVEFDLLCCVI